MMTQYESGVPRISGQHTPRVRAESSTLRYPVNYLLCRNKLFALPCFHFIFIQRSSLINNDTKVCMHNNDLPESCTQELLLQSGYLGHKCNLILRVICETNDA